MIQFTRHDIPLRTLASGAQLTVPVFRFTGDAGPAVYIQANIHGPEIAGCGAIFELLKFLRAQETLHGSITLVPSINPVGLDTKIMGQQVGYMDLNDPSVSNWNRIYPLLVESARDPDAGPHEPEPVDLAGFVAAHRESDEATIVQAFRVALRAALEDVRRKQGRYGLPFRHIQALAALEMALAHDYVLDLHTAGRAAHHLYIFKPYREMATYWRIPYVIQLPDDFTGALDEACILPWLRLQKAFRTHAGREIPFRAFQKEAYTVELGSADTLSAAAMREDAARIINYLRAKGVLEGAAVAGEVASVWCTMADYARYAAPTGGFLLWEKALGETVAAGETFAVILRPYAVGDDTQPDTIPLTAREEGILMNCTETHVVQEGMPVCAIMTHVQAVEVESA